MRVERFAAVAPWIDEFGLERACGYGRGGRQDRQIGKVRATRPAEVHETLAECAAELFAHHPLRRRQRKEQVRRLALMNEAQVLQELLENGFGFPVFQDAVQLFVRLLSIKVSLICHLEDFNEQPPGVHGQAEHRRRGDIRPVVFICAGERGEGVEMMYGQQRMDDDAPELPAGFARSLRHGRRPDFILKQERSQLPPMSQTADEYDAAVFLRQIIQPGRHGELAAAVNLFVPLVFGISTNAVHVLLHPARSRHGVLDHDRFLLPRRGLFQVHAIERDLQFQRASSRFDDRIRRRQVERRDGRVIQKLLKQLRRQFVQFLPRDSLQAGGRLAMRGTNHAVLFDQAQHARQRGPSAAHTQFLQPRPRGRRGLGTQLDGYGLGTLARAQAIDFFRKRQAEVNRRNRPHRRAADPQMQAGRHRADSLRWENSSRKARSRCLFSTDSARTDGSSRKEPPSSPAAENPPTVSKSARLKARSNA